MIEYHSRKKIEKPKAVIESEVSTQSIYEPQKKSNAWKWATGITIGAAIIGGVVVSNINKPTQTPPDKEIRQGKATYYML